MTLDTHQHFWSVGDGRYDYPQPSDGALYRDFGPEDLFTNLSANGVDRTLVVQAVEAEWGTYNLLALSQSIEWIAGVVGWCDLRRPDASATLEGYRACGRLVGVRPMLQKHNEVEWLLGDDAHNNLKWLTKWGLKFEALIDVRHLEIVAQLAASHPDLQIIIDHMAKPWRYPDRMKDWIVGMRRLSGHLNCHVKVSGYPFTPTSGDPDYAHLCHLLLDWFGPARLMWGSDWPVSTRHVPYEQCIKRAREVFSSAAWAHIAHQNAERIYSLDDT